MKVEPRQDRPASSATAHAAVGMSERDYRMCARCVMDTTDPEITFDETGVCNHCRKYEQLIKSIVWSPEESREKLPELARTIQNAGRGRDYDCLIGVSGGVDSTYVALLVKRLGLRPLAVHLDNGWDSELAVNNIELTLKTLGIDLYTEVLDWEEFRDLQMSFIKASTPDLEIPTDHAIVAILMKLARKHRIKYVITGQNIRTEGIMPHAWSAGQRDWKYIKSVQRLFGTKKLRTFPHFTMFEFIWHRLMGQRWVAILNYIDYNKHRAMEELQSDVGWRPYGGKHHESRYTRFFQSYYLPTKFKADKRRGHLSTLVNSGEMTREKALELLQEPICDPALLKEDLDFVTKKFGITEERLHELMAQPNKSIRDYPAYENGVLLQVLRAIFRLPRYLKLRFRPNLGP